MITELFRDEQSSRLESPDICQPVCTAIQVALVDLLKTWGVKPSAVVGHSSGEIAAAYAKGAINREDAWKIAYYRGYLSNSISSLAPNLNGCMLATGIGAEAAESYITRLSKGSANVACINSPESTTLSGDKDAIEELEQMIKADGQFARMLRVTVAYHSSHMQVIASQYHEVLGDIRPLIESDETVEMFSSLTGERINSDKLDSSYWVGNLVSPVKFSVALENLLKFTDPKSKLRNKKKSFVEHIIEVGPHSALQGPIKQILNQEALAKSTTSITYQSALERGKNSYRTAVDVAGRLFQHGYPVLVSAVNNEVEVIDTDSFLVDMPPFGWNHTLKYWSETHNGRAHRFRKHPRMDLFGGETREMLPDQPRYRNILRLTEVPWAALHKVQGSVLYPAAGMMIMAIEAMKQKSDPTREIQGYDLRDVIISRAIVVPQGEAGVETMLTLKPFRHGSRALGAAWQEFQLYSRAEAWELNCSGLIRLEYKPTADGVSIFADEAALEAEKYASEYHQISSDCSRGIHPNWFYDQLDSIGLHYGGVFQGLTEIRKGEYRSACRVKIPDTKSIMPRQFEYPHVIHPTTLDSMIQMALPASCGIDEDLTVPMVPVAIGRLYVSADVPSEPGTILAGYATSEITGFDEGRSQVIVSTNEWSKPLIIFDDIKGKRLSSSASGQQTFNAHLRSKVGSFFHWQQDFSLLTRQQIRDLCLRSVGESGRVDRQVLLEIEMACLVIMKRTVQECSPEEAKSFEWYYRLFHEYMQHCLELGEEKKFPYQADTPDIDWLHMDKASEDDLLTRVAQTSTGGAALVHHGNHLPQILRGEIPPLQVLMQDNFLHDFYSAGIGTEQHYAQMCWYIDMLAHKNPNMHVLEVGAGTAAATFPVLQKLGGASGTAPRFHRYTFTDISVGYFEKARTKLAPWLPFLDFARLNIEEDPSEQGFELGSYDLIIASNVLHATKCIHKTLDNTRKLLKP
jgi:acyl transferase domain-containing protein